MGTHITFLVCLFTLAGLSTFWKVSKKFISNIPLTGRQHTESQSKAPYEVQYRMFIIVIKVFPSSEKKHTLMKSYIHLNL